MSRGNQSVMSSKVPESFVFGLLDLKGSPLLKALGWEEKAQKEKA